MLNEIVLENFKGYRNETVIPLAPITLLYGPNSAGKSSVFHALLYAYEVLKNDWCDVEKSTMANVDLGGFLNLVNRNSAESKLRIGLGFDIPIETMVDYQAAEHRLRGFGTSSDDLEDFSCRHDFGIVSPSGEMGADSRSLEFTVEWSEPLGRPYVSRLKVGLEEQHILSITSDPEGNMVNICDINFEHRFLSSPAGEVAPQIRALIYRLLNEDSSSSANDELAIPIKCGKVGAKPILGKSLQIVFPEERSQRLSDEFWGTADSAIERSDEERKEYFENFDREQRLRGFLCEVFTHIVVTTIHAAVVIIESMATIGPMRSLPDRSFVPQRRLDPKRWYEGLAGWDIAHTCSEEEFSKISQWMFRLRTGYTLSRISDQSSNTNIHSEKAKHPVVILRDLNGNIFFAPDVGIGVSQLLPVVVATCVNDVGFVYVEQPELHIHPALQVELGDLLCAHVSPISYYSGDGMEVVRLINTQFLLETHSEHLLLRLLKRIRQTNDGEIDHLHGALYPKDVAVIYIDNTHGESSAKRLHIDEDGEFLDPWPRGFFRERGEELF